MTPEEHRTRAEELIRDVDRRVRASSGWGTTVRPVMTEADRERVTLAQVHATLGTASPAPGPVLDGAGQVSDAVIAAMIAAMILTHGTRQGDGSYMLAVSNQEIETASRHAIPVTGSNTDRGVTEFRVRPR